LNKISSFLKAKDYFCFMNADKIIREKLNKNLIYKEKLFKQCIEEKSQMIKILNDTNFNKEYDVTESEIEKIMKEYIQNRKVPGIELKDIIAKSLNFIEKDVKKPLNIQTNENDININNRSKSFLGR
jgi:hypothetical protein